MKTAVFGFGENFETQVANCTIYAMKEGYEIVGSYSDMGNLINRIKERDIDMVLLDKAMKPEYGNMGLMILGETIGRYGASVGVVE